MTPLATGPGAGGVGPDRPGWALLLGRGTVEVQVDRGRGERSAAALRDLPSGTPVALLAGGFGGRARLRRVARAGGVDLDREHVLLPGLGSTVVTVEDRRATVRWLWRNIATVPPGLARTALAVDTGLRLGAVLPWPLLGLCARGRLALGHRR